MHKLTAIDLFCGCGGLTLGLKQAGFRVLAAVDNDALSVETYSANHPEVKVLEKDIRELKTLSVKRKLKLHKGQLDLLAGCPPCQGFSTMRTLNGSRKVKDPRNDLLLEFQRFVEDFLPKTVMVENVPGLKKDRYFREFCKQLREMGYLGEHRIMDVSQFGVPQRRRRLIYLAGHRISVPFASFALKTKTVRESIGSLPPAGESGDPLHDFPEKRSPEVIELIRKIPKDGGSRTDLPQKYQLDCHKECDGFKDVYGRMSWDKVAPTITSGCFNPSKGRFLHPVEDRTITMREAALLQGFPKKYRFPDRSGKVSIALMIGNALPPPFIAAHARSIKKVLR
jgi:DNA (cytosine-5)-methyltransferase 1